MKIGSLMEDEEMFGVPFEFDNVIDYSAEGRNLVREYYYILFISKFNGSTFILRTWQDVCADW